MRVMVWGLGYVGTVSAACLAKMGHDVIGVESNVTKVEAINSGRSAIKEPNLVEVINEVVKSGKLQAVADGVPLVSQAELSMICVGTPSAADGTANLSYIRNVVTQIGLGLHKSENYHVVVVRSTLFPGTTRSLVRELLETHSGKKAGTGFGLVSNPEFMRETTAISDFYQPPYTVIGELDARSGDVVCDLYKDIAAPQHRVALEEAELLKLANNAFHAVKVSFSNEIGRVCARLGIDSHVVMKMVCADTKLNISPAYMKPGFAIGGSCLPKDLRSLTTHAKRLGAELPMLEAVMPSNRLQIEEARMRVHQLGVNKVAVLGLSFKPGTDDLRESPAVELIRALWQDGIDTYVCDPDIDLETMLGSNREYLERQLPQIRSILRPSTDESLRECQAIVVNQNRPEFREVVRSLNGHVAIIDLVRLVEKSTPNNSKYQGISW